MNDRIVKRIELQTVSRAWRALTDYREFGAWFHVELTAPFVSGKEAVGQITPPGYEHVTWRAVVQWMEPERLFSLTWQPYAIEPGVDYSAEPQTLIEFRLEPSGEGTALNLTESGFDSIPADRRAEAFRMNDSGWTQQMENIRLHVEATPNGIGHGG